MTSPLVHKPLLRVLAGQREAIPPLWLMRQAGRYLPEYRALREQAAGFLDLCFDSKRAAEITLQPIRRFGFDAAILFSDILVVPHALGQRVNFVEGEGPQLGDVDGVLGQVGVDLTSIFSSSRPSSLLLLASTVFREREGASARSRKSAKLPRLHA